MDINSFVEQYVSRLVIKTAANTNCLFQRGSNSQIIFISYSHDYFSISDWNASQETKVCCLINFSRLLHGGSPGLPGYLQCFSAPGSNLLLPPNDRHTICFQFSVFAVYPLSTLFKNTQLQVFDTKSEHN